MKIKIPKKSGDNNNTVSAKTIDRYAPFGDLSETFKAEGWVPERWNDEVTEYKPSYGLLKSLPNGGYLSIRGGNKNGVFHILMKDKNGNVVGQPLLQNANAKQVNDYFTNYNAQNNYGQPIGSVINQRANQIQANPNLDNTLVLNK